MDNYKDTVLTENMKIKDAIITIEKSHSKIGLVVNKDFKLIATISDGDIRRGILKGLTLDSPITEILHLNFISVGADKSRDEIIEIMKINDINQIPIINEKGKLIGLHLLNEFIGKRDINNIVVIMAGGKGKRLRPFTEICPKPMLKIGEKPILEIIINRFKDHGFKNFYISVNYLKEQVINYFGDGQKLNINIQYIIEKEPLGTAGSLKKLPTSEKNPYLVVNGDVISSFNPSQVLEFHMTNKSDMTICAHNYEHKIPFGVMETKGIKLQKILEKPSYHYLVNAGVYVIDPSLNTFIPEDKFFDMPDLINACSTNKKEINVFPIHEYWLDIGLHENLKEARKKF